MRLTATPALLCRFPTLLAVSGAAAAALGIAGWMLANLGIDTRLAIPAATPYPYVPGTLARAQGLTPAPAMLASIGTLALILYGAWLGSGRRRPIAEAILLGTLGAGVLLTFSKTIVCLATGAFVALALRRSTEPMRRRHAGLLVTGCVILASIYTLATHVVAIAPADRARLVDGSFIAGEPLVTGTIGGRAYLAMPTNYYFNKRASLIAIHETWPWGLGPGRHPRFVGTLMTRGRHPATLWQADPHSVYLGTAAELGAFGVAGLAALGATIILTLAQIYRRWGTSSWVAAGLTGAYAAILVEGIATDVMNFRHYWWLLAVTAAWSSLRPSSASRSESSQEGGHRPTTRSISTEIGQ